MLLGLSVKAPPLAKHLLTLVDEQTVRWQHLMRRPWSQKGFLLCSVKALPLVISSHLFQELTLTDEHSLPSNLLPPLQLQLPWKRGLTVCLTHRLLQPSHTGKWLEGGGGRGQPEEH